MVRRKGSRTPGVRKCERQKIYAPDYEAEYFIQHDSERESYYTNECFGNFSYMYIFPLDIFYTFTIWAAVYS